MSLLYAKNDISNRRKIFPILDGLKGKIYPKRHYLDISLHYLAINVHLNLYDYFLRCNFYK